MKIPEEAYEECPPSPISHIEIEEIPVKKRKTRRRKTLPKYVRHKELMERDANSLTPRQLLMIMKKKGEVTETVLELERETKQLLNKILPYTTRKESASTQKKQKNKTASSNSSTNGSEVVSSNNMVSNNNDVVSSTTNEVVSNNNDVVINNNNEVVSNNNNEVVINTTSEVVSNNNDVVINTSEIVNTNNEPVSTSEVVNTNNDVVSTNNEILCNTTNEVVSTNNDVVNTSEVVNTALRRQESNGTARCCSASSQKLRDSVSFRLKIPCDFGILPSPRENIRSFSALQRALQREASLHTCSKKTLLLSQAAKASALAHSPLNHAHRATPQELSRSIQAYANISQNRACCVYSAKAPVK
ncbi:uncharacterized protein NEMAJ01_0731 [Nematocida major]|uniref:uncharacterized protein n=1 Tax=Nematocida major TaxID=1912982 RepID=UPI0020085815|nr:uncharacterized protein NEMAJ01_0731 [Nematocida major]KAH9385835.1 hypothetical protein NEMAJ01_0731 [Nematocida major]